MILLQIMHKKLTDQYQPEVMRYQLSNRSSLSLDRGLVLINFTIENNCSETFVHTSEQRHYLFHIFRQERKFLRTLRNIKKCSMFTTKKFFFNRYYSANHLHLKVFGNQLRLCGMQRRPVETKCCQYPPLQFL